MARSMRELTNTDRAVQKLIDLCPAYLPTIKDKN